MSDMAPPESPSKLQLGRSKHAVLAKRAGDHMKVLGDDVGKVKGAIKAKRQFYFLRTDAHRVYGLQDWPSSTWEKHVRNHQERGKQLARELSLPYDAGGGYTVSGLSDAIRAKLNEPMTLREWRAVCAFQNGVLNAVHEEDAPGALYYMDPAILSNHLFDREFPLGVEDRVMRDKWRHAIHHSGLSRVVHTENTVVSCAIYLVMLLLVIVFFSYLCYVMAGKPTFAMASSVFQCVLIMALMPRVAVDTSW